MVLGKTLINRSSVERLQAIINCCIKAKYAGFSTSSASCKPSIHLSKTHALVNEKVCISVTGLQANQKVTLQTFVDEGNKSFGSCGHYVADHEGKVNTFEHECYGGTYDGLEPMGLFWSMQSLPGGRPRRILNIDVTVPVSVEISLHPDHTSFADLPWMTTTTSMTSQRPLASSNFYQHFCSEGVKVIPVKEDGVFGTLFLPDGPGPFPAVIDLFGIVPVVPGHRSSLLASCGIASFSLTYVGKEEELASSPFDMDFNYFLKAFDWLSRHPSIDCNALGGVGSCIGGAYLSLIAWKRPNMRCLVGINSPPRPQGPTQEVEGEMVEHTEQWNWDLREERDGALAWRPMSRVEDNTQSLPYWRHKAKILQILGEDDQCCNPDCLVVSHQAVPDEFKSNVDFVHYPGAGHILEPPYIPLCRTNYNSIFQCMMLWGGQPKQHAHAQEDSWPRVVDFLKRNLIEDSHRDK